MKLKSNVFERIKQYYVEDGLDVHWWIDEDHMDEFKENWSDSFIDPDNPIKITKERELSGRQWNEWLIGGVYGDYEGYFVNEECPDCKHLLVTPDETSSRFCSNCHYTNIDDELKDNLESKPSIKIRLVGENVFEFCKRVGLSDSSFIKKDNTYFNNCITCNKVVPVKEFYICKESGMAVVSFSHDNCTNGGPAVLTTYTDKSKKDWGIL